MIIKRIELCNFRIYYGSNTIDLSTEKDKNIIIVSGENGFGKTTFLMSLVWCLYGKQMEKVDDLYKLEIKGKGNYSKYIVNTINKKAHDEGNTMFSVSITFGEVDIPGIECDEIMIKRSYDVSSNNGDDLVIKFDGKENNTVFSAAQKEKRINDEEMFIREYIMPLEIAKFYLFDAEKIVAYAQVDSPEQREKLSLAYSQVLGIQKYENLKNELENIRNDYKKESASTEDRMLINTLEANIENDKLSQEQESEYKAKDEEKINLKQAESLKLQDRIVREGDAMSPEQLTKLREEQNGFREQMTTNQEALKSLFNFIPFGLSGQLFCSLLEQVRKEKKYREVKIQQEGAENKTEELLSDLDNASFEAEFPIDRKIRRFYEDAIKSLIKKHFYNEIDSEEFADFHYLHKFSELQENTLMSLVSKVKGCKSAFLELYGNYKSAEREYNNIESKIREAERKTESGLSQALRKEKDIIDSEIKDLYTKVAEYDVNIGKLSESIKANKQQKENLLKKIKASDKNQPKIEELDRLIRNLQTFLERFKEQKKHSLENRIKDKLVSFLHKDNLIGKAEVFIHGNSIDISLLDKNGKKIDINTLSMGERQMFSSALLGSLVEETDIEFPVFIDSPMQKFDAEHTENVLKKFYPYVSKQVVLFPLLKKELTELEYSMIKDIVCKTYKISNRENGSFFEPVEKNKLFN